MTALSNCQKQDAKPFMVPISDANASQMSIMALHHPQGVCLQDMRRKDEDFGLWPQEPPCCMFAGAGGHGCIAVLLEQINFEM